MAIAYKTHLHDYKADIVMKLNGKWKVWKVVEGKFILLTKPKCGSVFPIKHSSMTIEGRLTQN